MLTIDLEKELLKENRKLSTPEELLIIKEHDKHEGLEYSDVLTRTGLNRQVIQGAIKKIVLNRNKRDTEGFDQNRVFHKSQIRSICLKYCLRFLKTKRYQGTIDNDLPVKISTFEIAHGVQCHDENTYIIAPKESFKLEEKPKDPLMFYEINEEYYYLIHKWGDDLSITRRLKGFFRSNLGLTMLIGFPLILGLFLFQSMIFGFLTTLFIVIFVITLIAIDIDFGEYVFDYKNTWNSKIK